MTTEQLRAAREANPFLAFTLRMADGRAFPIPHRDYISIPPAGRIVFVCQSDGTAHILDLSLATELTIEPAGSPEDVAV